MGFTVGESTTGRERRQNAIVRTYIAAHDGSGPSDEETARQAIAAWLGTQTDGGTPLSTALKGMVASNLEVTEVEGTEGAAYTGVATWGQVVQEFSGERLALYTEVLAEAAVNAASAQGQITRSLSGSPQGRSIDFAPLRCLFSREEDGDVAGQGAAPPFDPLALNPSQSAEDGAVLIGGLDYNPPNPDLLVNMEFAGSPVRSDFVKTLVDAAKRGVLNTDTFSVGGLTYQPLELLLVDARVQVTTNGATQIAIGFATGLRETVVVGATTPRKAGMGLFLFDAPQFFLWAPTPGTLAGGSQNLFISPHDYKQRFIAKKVEGEKTIDEVTHVMVNKVWGELGFASLFGRSSL